MLPELVALVLLVALTAYALSGGADFGGGVWDLFARGPHKHLQRKIIERAIAPIWEANHVWLILMVVILFVALPAGYAAISTALHIPLLVMLIGIVLRVRLSFSGPTIPAATTRADGASPSLLPASSARSFWASCWAR